MLPFLKSVRANALLGLLLVALTGCAVRPLAPDQLARIRTIGIVAAVDEHVARDSIALIAFGNEITHGDVSAWQLNTEIAAALQKTLAGHYQTEILVADTTPEHGRGNLLAANLGMLLAPKGMSDQDRVRTAIKPGQAPVDAYLVVTSEEAPEFAGTNQTVSGLTVWSYLTTPVAAAPLRVSLLDGTTLTTLATYYAPANDPRFRAPSEMLPDSMKHDRWEDYSPAEQAELHEVFRRVVISAIDRSLELAGLTTH